MISSPNHITAHNAGWPSQIRFAVSAFWSGVCEFWLHHPVSFLTIISRGFVPIR